MLTVHPRTLPPAPRSPAQHEAALALASLADALNSLDTEPVASPDTDADADSDSSDEGDKQDEEGGSSSGSDTSEPWGLDRRETGRRLWERPPGGDAGLSTRGFCLHFDVDTESEDYSSGEEQAEVARQQALRAARQGQADLRAVELDASEVAATIAFAQAVQRQRQESWQRRAREHAAWRQRQLEDELAAVEAEEAAAVREAQATAEAALTRLVAEDAAADAAEEAALAARLAAVDAAAREKGDRVAGLLVEEERQRQERSAAAAAAKAAAEAAAKAAADAAEARAAAERAAREKREADEKAKAYADAAAAAAAAQARSQTRAASVQAATARAAPRATATAIAAEKELAAMLGAARAQAAPYVADAASKPARRQFEKRIVVAVQQISATKEQVMRKAADLSSVLTSLPSGPQLAHAMLWLVDKMLAQVETQVTRLPGFAFALAEVCMQTASNIASVSQQHAQLLPLLLGRMHESVVLTVPKVYVYTSSAWQSEDQYFRAMGYTTHEDGTTLETTDAFLARTGTMCRFLGALMQSDAAPRDVQLAQLVGLPGAWAFLARLLNGTPPGRDTGAALEGFLTTAAWRLHMVYGRQFAKVLATIHSQYLPKVDASPDADARPVAVRLRAFIEGGEHTRPHEGRNMPQTDMSTEMHRGGR